MTMNWLDQLVGIWKREDPEVRAHVDVSGLSRRRFVQILAGSAAVAAAAPLLDVERLLWVPGQTVVVPEIGGATGGIFLTTDWITRAMARSLVDQLTLASSINRRYDPIQLDQQRGVDILWRGREFIVDNRNR